MTNYTDFSLVQVGKIVILTLSPIYGPLLNLYPSNKQSGRKSNGEEKIGNDTNINEGKEKKTKERESFLFVLFFSLFFGLLLLAPVIGCCQHGGRLPFLFLSKSSDVNSSNIVVAKGAEVKEFIARCRLILEIMMKSSENVVVV